MAKESNSESRTHLILVPGFGGFDSLGQLRYYVGVTEKCTAWRQDRKRIDLALHYFDNLPTASVATRARKLKRYVEKLVDRGVIAPRDRVVLGGHSTGGLDIRQLVRDLRDDKSALLSQIKRIAYLSVPQRGTNIAEWLLQADVARASITQLLRRAVGLPATSPLYAAIERFDFILRWAVRGRPELMDAIEDARRDLDTSVTDAYELAEARRSRAEVDLWLTHAADDFLALDDLSSRRWDATRLVEQPTWVDAQIQTRSYATVGHNPFGELPADLASYPQIFAAAHADHDGTDGVYRLAYRACAGGSFRATGISAPWLAGCRPAGMPDRYAPSSSDNDGIVNTASMIADTDSWLVPGDHADIIGHFTHFPKPPTAPPGRRRYERYDLLASASAPHFESTVFQAVWFDLFDFAVAPD